MPKHLVLQADNTVSQCKNSVAGMFLAWLVCKGKFLTCTLNFLVAGHTHEDVDRLFALILSLVLRRCSWETPEDLVDRLREKMKHHVGSKKEELGVEYVENIRDFDEWLAHLRISLQGCFVPREGRPAMHSFVYKIRADLSPAQMASVKNVPGRAKPEETQMDVFALTKGRMYMTEWKAPVLCLPERALQKMTADVPLMERARKDLKGKDNLKRLEDALREKLVVPKIRAADKIRSFRAEEEGNHPPPLQWLAAEAPPRAAVSVTGNAYYEHLADTSWNLLATFHRGDNKKKKKDDAGEDADEPKSAEQLREEW